MVSGASNTGKSYLVNQIIQFRDILIDKPVDAIFVYYKTWQPLYDELKTYHPSVIFKKNIDISIEPEYPPPTTCHIYLFDDHASSMKFGGVGSYILNFFVMWAHHCDILTFFTTQNIFMNNDFQRTMSLNSSYLIMFRNLRDIIQVENVAQQIYGRHKGDIKPFMDVYNKEMSPGTGNRYILVNTHSCELNFPKSVYVNIIPSNSLNFKDFERAYVLPLTTYKEEEDLETGYTA